MPNPGEIRIVERNGEKITCIWTISHWKTIREYYSHDGPGWDSRMELLNDAKSLQLYGRTFSAKEVLGRKGDLPDLPHYWWEEKE